MLEDAAQQERLPEKYIVSGDGGIREEVEKGPTEICRQSGSAASGRRAGPDWRRESGQDSRPLTESRRQSGSVELRAERYLP
jgi:hypothetical protein